MLGYIIMILYSPCNCVVTMPVTFDFTLLNTHKWRRDCWGWCYVTCDN